MRRDRHRDAHRAAAARQHSDQAFQYIQEFTGFFTPGITVIFLLGLFWKRASEAGAITAAVGRSFVLSLVMKLATPGLAVHEPDAGGVLRLAGAGGASSRCSSRRAARRDRIDTHGVQLHDLDRLQHRARLRS